MTQREAQLLEYFRSMDEHNAEIFYNIAILFKCLSPDSRGGVIVDLPTVRESKRKASNPNYPYNLK